MTQIGADVLKNNLTNVARNYEWDFEIPAPRGTGSNDVWFIRAQSSSIPGKFFESIHVDYKATAGFEVVGRERYSHSFQVTLIESQDAGTFQAINSWQNLAVDAIDGTGSPDSDLKTDAIISLKDESDNIWMAIKLIGIWPKNVPDVPLTYGNSAAIMYPVTFSYDRWETVGSSSGLGLSLNINF